MFQQIGLFLSRLSRGRAVTVLRALVRANEFFLIPIAIIIGVAAGAIVTTMSEIAQLAHVLIYGIPIDLRLSANEYVNPSVALTAVAGGGLSLGIMEFLRRRWKISAAVDPVEANALRGGRLSMRDSFVVSAQTLISNGCGASVGLEAGYTQMVSGVASAFGRFLNLRRTDLRLIVGSGAAGAIAAAFGAPITGAFYACELIVGVYSVSSAAPLLGASLSAALVAQSLGGAPYSLFVSKINTAGAEQYLAWIALALIVGAVGIVLMTGSALVERVFRRVPVLIRPVIGGLCVGGAAAVTPQVLAAGHGAMVLDLHQTMLPSLIAVIIGLKLCSCLISLASGFRGGLFFASLFVGSLIGKLYAVLLAMSPFAVVIDPVVAALVGMATLGVAVVGGPLTMTFLVLEMTHSVDVSATVLAACICTSIFVRALFGHSFSTWRLHLRGETIRSANDVGWLRNLTVERMMRTDVAKVNGTMSMLECRREHPLGSRPAIVVTGNASNYVGLVMLAELYSGDLDAIAADIQVVELVRFGDVVLTPQMNVKEAMKVFDRTGAEVLAVADDSRNIIGLLSESFARRRYVDELDQATHGLLI